MKVFNIFTISAVSAKRHKGKQSKGRNSLESTQGRQFNDCGGIFEFTKEMTSVEIFSPVDPEEGTVYPPNAFCEWLLQDECADSFTIKTIKFDIEGNSRCTWDYLAFENQDQTFNATYCNDDNDDYYDYYDYISSDLGFHALEEGSEMVIPGNSISMSFISDGVVQQEGFQILVIPNRPEGSECTANVNEPTCVFPYNNDGSVKMKTWSISTHDKLVPFSNYADSFEQKALEGGGWPVEECANRCVATPGCFKFKIFGQNCTLRGNKMEEPRSFSYAINGEDCPSEPSSRLWKDRKAKTQVFCHFSGVESAERYLEYLRSKNQQMTKWNVTDVGGHNGALTTRKMTRRWTFSEATERPTTWGHWYTFVTTIFFRDYLVPVNATSAQEQRKRRQADDDEELIVIANQEVQDFIANLEIGDDVEVLETEVSEIELESLDPIDDTDENQMIYAYSSVRNHLESSMKSKGTRRQPQKMKQFDHVNRRFSWMYDHASKDCGTPTDSIFGTEKWISPEIMEDNICSSFVFLMESTMSFYDHKVCLDNINLKENRRARRRYERIESDFFRSKKVFNRLLRGLKCEEQLETY